MADPLDIDGPAAPPRDNGELVFDAPWQGRAFAMAVALHEDGAFAWDELRDQLIARLGQADDAEPATYWGAWLAATEAVVAERGLVPTSERLHRHHQYTQRPPGHDHDHDHDHDH